MSENMSDPAPRENGGATQAPNDIPPAPQDAQTTRLPAAQAPHPDATREMPQAPAAQAGAPATGSATPAPDPRRVWTQRPGQAPSLATPAPSAQAPGGADPRLGAHAPSGAAPAGAGIPRAGASGAQGAYRAPGYQAPQGSGAYGTGPQPQWWPNAQAAAPAQAQSASKRKRGALVTKQGPSWLALVLAMLLTALLSLGGAWAMIESRPASVASVSSDSSSTTKESTTVTPVTSTGDSPDWQAVAEAVSPAVVTISVTTSSGSGVGSGVIYDAEGDIVTNYHVISSALAAQGQISVTLEDGRIYEAEVVGSDQTTDLAVIRLINAPSDLTVATFGSSSDLAVGQEVMAIGAPLGLSNTVTTGIISALNRPVEVSTSDSESEQVDPNDPFGQIPQLQNNQTSNSDSVITNAIQVDASINPGNSGGPLFDSTGKVIGINSSIASNSSSSDTAGSIGLGFAIPVDLVTSVADQLISTGTVDHAVLGVTVTTGSASVDSSQVAGAEIAEVTSGGGADAAGLKSGDLIIAVDGETVSSSKQLTGYIRRYMGGDEVTITYVRDGEKYEVQATLSSQQG